MNRRNLLVVVASAFLNGIEVGIVNVVWQPYVLSFGVPVSVLGIITSVSGWNGIIPTLISPVSGWLADKRGRKLVLLGASAALMASYALYALAGATGVLLLLVPGILFAGAAAIARPVSSALTGESVRTGRQASAYSLVVFASTLPGIFAPLAVGWLAERAGYGVGFPLALAAEAIAFGLIARWLYSPPRADARPGQRDLRLLLRRAFRPLPNVGAFFLMSAMDSFSWGMGWGLLFGLLNREYHYDAWQLGIVVAFMNASMALMQLPIGRLIDRRGCKPILALSEALGPPLLFIWMTQSRFEVIVASMALFALNAALWIPARNTFLTRAAPPDGRAEAFGRLNAFTGLLAFPAPFIGGFLYDHWGYPAPFLANLIGSCLTLIVILLYVREPRTVQSQEFAGPTPHILTEGNDRGGGDTPVEGSADSIAKETLWPTERPIP